MFEKHSPFPIGCYSRIFYTAYLGVYFFDIKVNNLW